MIRCCYKCTERHDLCHSTCERYLTEKAENDAKKKQRYDEKQIGVTINNLEYHRLTHRKNRRKTDE